MGELFFLLADKRARMSTTHSPPAYAFGGSSQVYNLMPDVGDKRRTDIPGLSYISALPGSFESSKAPQSTDTHSGTNNVPPALGYGVDNLYGDAAGVSRDLRSAYATTQETTGSEMNATGECGEAYTVMPTQEPFWSSTPDLANNSSRQKDCTCISCCGACLFSNLVYFGNEGYRCRFPSCQEFATFYVGELCGHEKSHYGQPGKYTCLEQDCHAVLKNFGDLKRHDKAKHCTHPNKEQYPCPVLWCKYSGSNGFTRKDKLKSHYKNIHEGKSAPAKAGRVIKPATLRPKVSGPESSASK